MADAPAAMNLDFEEQRARIRRALDEADRLAAERLKLGAERDKLAAEARKLKRDRTLAPWQIVMSSMAAGAVLFGAGAAFIKLLGSRSSGFPIPLRDRADSRAFRSPALGLSRTDRRRPANR